MPIQTNLKDFAPIRERLKRKTQLISGGYSVREALPGGAVTVFPWETSISEWLATRNFAAEGEVQTMTELVRQVTGLPVETIGLLPEGEIPMILMVSRALAFDEQKLRFIPVCPHCNRVQDPVTVRVPDDLKVVAQRTADYTGAEPPVTLPVAKDAVVIRPLLVNDILAIERRVRNPDPGARKVPEAIMRLAAAVVSVGGGTPDTAQELVRYLVALHPADVEFLRTALNGSTPSLSNDIDIHCDNEGCAKDFKHVLSLRRDFF